MARRNVADLFRELSDYIISHSDIIRIIPKKTAVTVGFKVESV